MPSSFIPTRVEFRLHGFPSRHVLIYLPGLHGNWTLVGPFRKALANRVAFVETTYPPTLNWSLEDYAAAVENSLAAQGINRGWLLAESFSSQVAWAILARKRFQLEGLILAGGFVRHPTRWGVRLAERLSGDLSLRLITRLLFGYAKIARWRFRNSPETVLAIEEFVAHLSEEERRAAKHRLRLVLENDPGDFAKGAQVPIYALTGFFDPVVPWVFVRRWLKKNCSALREYRIFWKADHNVLGTAASAAADQVVSWITT